MKTRINLYLPLMICLIHLTGLAVHAGTLQTDTAPVGARPLDFSDLHRMAGVSEPALSADGKVVVYSVSTHNMDLDKAVSDIWMLDYSGKNELQLTHTERFSEWHPLFSPDGNSIAFLSDRGDDQSTQVWLMSVTGGEAYQLTHFPGGLSDFVWSSDGKQLAVIAADSDDELPKSADGKDKPIKPLIIDRYQFKDDENGYLNHKRSHLYRVDIAEKLATQMTFGDHDEFLPAWSPDGQHIAYVSKRGRDPDRHINWDIYMISLKDTSTEQQITTFKGADLDPEWESRLSWSPDNRHIAYLQSGEDKWIYYSPWQLSIVDTQTGQYVMPAAIDRCFNKPKWSSDGKAIYALIEESRNTYLSRIDIKSGAIKRLTNGHRFDSDFDISANGHIALLSSDDTHPAELFSYDGSPHALSHQNDLWRNQIHWQNAEDISFKSADGSLIDGFLVKPGNYVAGKKYPTVLRIHGGPVYQFSHELMFDWQLLAAKGYAVVAVNPRGSSGRGFDFAKAIYADWGNLDRQDVLAGVDHVVEMGIADPERLCVGGWSYGSILTNYVIAKDQRFKAATSGAGTSNMFGNYGLDEYIREYEFELGTPWADPENYARVSYPFLHADTIKTPTLFLCAQLDFNVPCNGAEQMYQALRSQNIATRLIEFPNEHHGLTIPSYLEFRLRSYVEWYEQFIKP